MAYFGEENRAKEVKTLIDVAIDCGYECNEELFERMFKTVYDRPAENECAGGIDVAGHTAAVVKAIADILRSKND